MSNAVPEPNSWMALIQGNHSPTTVSSDKRRGRARLNLPCWLVVVFLALQGGLVLKAAEVTVPTVSTNRVNTALIPKPGGSDTWWRRHNAMNSKARTGDVGLVYIGDSIVNSWQWDGEPVWKHYYEPRKGMVCGITGDRTEQVLWRLQHGNIDGITPKLAIVMIGQNNGPSNTGEEIGAGIAAIVQLLREKLPSTKILLLAIFPRGEKVTPEREVLATANGIAAKLADGKQIFYRDINHLFLAPDGGVRASLMPDYEHPNEEGHRAWAAAIEPLVAQLMGDKPVPEIGRTQGQPSPQRGK